MRRAPATTRLAVAGDVMLGRHVADQLLRHPPGHVWGDVIGRMVEADARFVNLECVLASGGEPADKAFTFRAPPTQAIEALRAARIDAVSMANNHVLDFGPGALLEMLEVLDAAGIAHAGAGADDEAAWRPARVRAGALTLGLLAFTNNEPGWAAAPRKPGVAYAPVEPQGRAFDSFRYRVAAAARECDALVVSAHWGPNMRRVPPLAFRAFAAATIDAGARLFWGHSAHLFQGIERRGPGLVLYDTGDFVDDYHVDEDERNDRSFLFTVELVADRASSVELVPVRIFPGEGQVRLAEGPDAAWSIHVMNDLCGAMGTALERRAATLVAA